MSSNRAYPLDTGRGQAAFRGWIRFMSYVAFAPGSNAGVFVAVDRVNFATFMALAGAANQVLDSWVTR